MKGKDERTPLSPHEIRALLTLKGVTGAEIARRAGVDRTAVYKVIAGNSRSLRLRRMIADALDLPYEEVWGQEEV